ncbi:histone deacetylase HDT3-like isoform X33 [Gossypium raimondii]|uniref:histone deacetylase HDT3-like isoform X32 n=1 Tax=Gossypium raimondii TaxID=29730 RepID=UPI00227B30C5|nr:histone deacetylase HDT3-like isoform X32 [Gossypium raimondii]XP_052476335.1 histone deacetylase HDT3-like isoform X33 [Gossypium raimondii]
MGSKLLNYRRNLSSVFSSLSSFSPFSFLQILCWISVLIKLIIKKGGKRRNFILGNFFSKKKKTRKNPNFTSLTLSMEFWGAEVKSGQNFEIELEDDGSRILHLSQVALGEGTGDNKKVKAKETICLYLKFKNEKFLVGTLSQEKCPQIALDLVLHDKFELSHTRKNGSVYVTGYYVGTSQGNTESEEDLLEPTMNLVQSVPAASDPTTTEQVTIVSSDKDEESSEEQEPRMLVNGENDSDDADSDEDDSDDADCDYHPDIDDADGNEDDGEEDSSDEDKKTPEKVMIYTKQVTIVSSDEDEESSEEQEPRMLVNGENDSDDADSDEDDGEEDSSDEDQKTPEKAGPSRKRPAMSSMKTPAAPKKKAKLVTPQKTGRFSLPSLPFSFWCR